MSGRKRKNELIKLNYQQFYHISMSNYNLDMETGVATKSMLKSNYSRLIYEVPDEHIGFAKYNISETFYKNNESSEFKRWTFAKDAQFYHTLYYLPDENYKNEMYQLAKEEETPYPTLDESFRKYPKLPSVYLLIMQVLDIIAFDSYLSIVNSNYSNIKITSDYVKIGDISKQSFEIGAGIYSDSSFYHNEDYYVRMIGTSRYQKQECYIFDFYSDPSDVYMKDREKSNAAKNKSLYSGVMYIAKNNGELLYGEMVENVVPVGKSRKFVQRKIIVGIRGEAK